MNRLILLAIGILFFIAVCGCAGPKIKNIAGNWTSSEGGSMTISQNGSDIRGTYSMKEGIIIGKLSGNTISGHWIQNSSGQRCSTLRSNSYYWGPMKLVFADDSYSGKWGYCDGPQNNPWTGQRR